jgi:hypothetical protein
VRLIETPSYLPLPDTRPARLPRAAGSAGGGQWAADRATVLPRLGVTRSLPFLAQYLAQEIIAPGEIPASRWSARASAYRLAAQSSDASPRQVVLDA